MNPNRPKLLFASNNMFKYQEIRDILQDDIELLSLKDIDLDVDIPETGNSLEENASQKAQFIHLMTAMDCFADDTGLEIEALYGKPGVISARYAGENCSFEDNIQKVLKEMEGIENREAMFRCCVCLIVDHKPTFFEGRVYGTILKEKRGADGFGYDPIFLPNGYDQSFAEMPIHLKNGISHRGRAVSKLIRFLTE
jgi:XTP/dITP diphosphohydrolase